ncbi:AAA family ATPase [Marinobacter salarius]|uniref:AAA family ATPase n=1 Tax=Marinobacter salarius TaxID=1420917 RepID=UPI00273AEAF2|nr:AAA family ATPase [Marinobacter salarius]MDP4533506.1 AAA family ATPase [Marinobacter salarius]
MNLNILKKQTQNPELTNALGNPSAYSEDFFSVDSSDIQPRLASTPDDRQYLAGGFLPQGIAGLLTGQGAVGKTTLTMQLGAAVATGTEFLGQPCQKGSVLMYLSEDDNCEISHRLHRIQQSLDGQVRSDLVKNLKIFPSPLIHLPMFDYDPAAGGPSATQHFGNLWAAAQKIKDLRLIVIDSYTRINNLDEVNHANASYVALSLEMLARDTGATVLMIHHPPKHGSSETRGSSALLNALRWTASLGYRKKGASGTGGLTLSVAKHNYGPTVSYQLQRQDNGLLSTSKPEPEESEQERNERVIAEVCRFIEESADKEKGVTFSQLRPHAGLNKQFQIAQEKLKALLSEACKQGKLILEDKHYKLPSERVQSVPKPKATVRSYVSI